MEELAGALHWHAVEELVGALHWHAVEELVGAASAATDLTATDCPCFRGGYSR